MNKKLIVFDMDGTVYLGKNLIDGALETFKFLKDNNIDYLFFTNNSSHDLDFYYKKVSAFGIPCSLEHNFFSSTEVTIDYLKEMHAKRIFVIGNKCLKDKLAKFFEITTVFDEKDHINAVVACFTTELVYQELKDASLYLQTRDVPFIATNGDFRCPIEDGLYIPDCGGMCEWLRLVSGKEAKIMGKPNPVVVDAIMKRYGVTKDEILLVGDRLYTDILVGVNSGVDTLCVLSGECTQEDIDRYPHKPTFISKSIKDLPALLKK